MCGRNEEHVGNMWKVDGARSRYGKENFGGENEMEKRILAEMDAAAYMAIADGAISR